jgi:hypothetical protein
MNCESSNDFRAKLKKISNKQRPPNDDILMLQIKKTIKNTHIWVSVPLPSLTNLTGLVPFNHHQSLHFHPLATQQATAPLMVPSHWEGTCVCAHTHTHTYMHTQKQNKTKTALSLLMLFPYDTSRKSFLRLEIQSKLTWMID